MSWLWWLSYISMLLVVLEVEKQETSQGHPVHTALVCLWSLTVH